MKKEYEEPIIIIELFPGQDIIVCSMGTNPEDPGDDPITFDSIGGEDS